MNFRLWIFFIASIILVACSRDPVPPAPNPPAPHPPNPTLPADTFAAGWRRIPTGLTFVISDIFFKGDTGYFTCGHDIYRSVDGGESWQQKFNKTYLFFNNIGMGNSRNGLFTLNFPGELIRTTDGGETFQTIYFENEIALTDVFFSGETTAYAVGRYFWKTTDAGNSWTKIGDFVDTVVSNYRRMYFLDDQVGYVAAYETGIYNTTDGGRNWTKTTPDSLASATNKFFSVFMLDNGTGFFATNTVLSKSTNSGNSWSAFKEFDSEYLHDIHFTDSSNGYYTDHKHIYKSSDGGLHWVKEVTVKDESFREIHFADKNHGWAVGSAGLLLKYNR